MIQINKIIVHSWNNSFKLKQFLLTTWWVSLIIKFSSIGAILKQSTSYFRINEKKKKHDTNKIRLTSYSNIFKDKYEFNKIKLLYLAK